MTIENVYRAQADAKRFLKCVEAVLKESVKKFPENGHKYLEYGKRTGALRRASMDLTRALAKMRKP